MKKPAVLVLSIVFATLSACGGGGESGSADSAANGKIVCDCFKSGTPDCDKKIEAIEEGFKKDPKTFDSFREAAMKICPEAQPEIDAMKP